MDHLVAAHVARRYYLDQRTKTQIADELGVSRFRVARLLEEAHRDGVVRIEVEAPSEVDLEAGQRVADVLGLRQVVVLRGEAGAVTRRQLGRAAAALLVERLSADDVLGVSWGRTLHALTEVVPRLAPAEVVQVVGAVPDADLRLNSLELVRRLGEATGGAVHALHAPMVLDSPEQAASLRASSAVAATLARFDEITCALVGVGAWTPGGSALRPALADDVAARLEAAGAVADVCSAVVDAGGELVGGDLPERCLSITPAQLRAVPDVLAVAGGADKAVAVRAAARAGLLHRLVTDDATATVLLGR